jgi:hypothetical protein
MIPTVFVVVLALLAIDKTVQEISSTEVLIAEGVAR